MAVGRRVRGRVRSVEAGRPRQTRAKVRAVSRRLQGLLARDRAPVASGPQDPAEAAVVAGLRYVSDDGPGIRRVGHGKGAKYLRDDGTPVKDEATLARIRALAIPPAWNEVWICPDPNGHIQASGRDARRRKQYRYHARWRETRDRTKFGRMVEFARALPKIRRLVDRDLATPGLPRRKVLAAVVRLLEQTRIRVGNDEYARSNGHYGLTTLEDRHVQIRGSAVRFKFTGKSGKEREIELRDPRLARIVRGCQEIPGQRLFQYDGGDGERGAIDSGDVNEYLREVSGTNFTAKDFRTWGGTVCVATALVACAEPTSAKAAQKTIVEAIDQAAQRLGNTRAVCRSSYVHPAVLDAFLEGWMWKAPGRNGMRPPLGLSPEEAATLRLLEVAASGRAKVTPLRGSTARTSAARARTSVRQAADRFPKARRPRAA